MRPTLLLALLGTLSLPACLVEAEPPPEPTLTEVVEAINAWLEAECEYAVLCCESDEPADDLAVELCKGVAAPISALVAGQIFLSIEAGRIHFNRDAAAACVEQLESCATVGRPAVCEEMFEARVALGDACVMSADCLSGACIESVCATPLGESEACEDDSQCAAGYCEMSGDCFEGQCFVKLGEGAPCCNSDCGCNDSACTSGVCDEETGTCAAEAPVCGG